MNNSLLETFDSSQQLIQQFDKQFLQRAKQNRKDTKSQISKNPDTEIEKSNIEIPNISIPENEQSTTEQNELIIPQIIEDNQSIQGNKIQQNLQNRDILNISIKKNIEQNLKIILQNIEENQSIQSNKILQNNDILIKSIPQNEKSTTEQNLKVIPKNSEENKPIQGDILQQNIEIQQESDNQPKQTQQKENTDIKEMNNKIKQINSQLEQRKKDSPEKKTVQFQESDNQPKQTQQKENIDIKEMNNKIKQINSQLEQRKKYSPEKKIVQFDWVEFNKQFVQKTPQIKQTQQYNNQSPSPVSQSEKNLIQQSPDQTPVFFVKYNDKQIQTNLIYNEDKATNQSFEEDKKPQEKINSPSKINKHKKLFQQLIVKTMIDLIPGTPEKIRDLEYFTPEKITNPQQQISSKKQKLSEYDRDQEYFDLKQKPSINENSQMIAQKLDQKPIYERYQEIIQKKQKKLEDLRTKLAQERQKREDKNDSYQLPKQNKQQTENSFSFSSNVKDKNDRHQSPKQKCSHKSPQQNKQLNVKSSYYNIKYKNDYDLSPEQSKQQIENSSSLNIKHKNGRYLSPDQIFQLQNKWEQNVNNINYDRKLNQLVAEAKNQENSRKMLSPGRYNKSYVSQIQNRNEKVEDILIKTLETKKQKIEMMRMSLQSTFSPKINTKSQKIMKQSKYKKYLL